MTRSRLKPLTESEAEDLEDMRALEGYRANPGESVSSDFIRKMLDEGTTTTDASNPPPSA